MTNKTYFILFLLDLLRFLSGANIFQCPSGLSTTFEKIVATRPGKDNSLLDGVFVFRSQNSSGLTWSSLECLKKCQSVRECHSVVVLHHNMECVGLPFIESNTLVVDNDANYFVKLCLIVPESCRTKLWSTESLNGYRLISQGSSVKIVSNVTDEVCSQNLLRSSGTNDTIRSAQFQIQSVHNTHYSGWVGKTEENTPMPRGKCTLTFENKFTEPESFRVATGDYWYKESQCVEDLPKKISRCSYEEYYNQTLKHYDVAIQGISTEECKNRCETENQFNCRGFTTGPFERGKSQFILSLGSDDKTAKNCYLHSEDTLSHGSWLLTRKQESVYYRRVSCLNVSVVCTPTAMAITYRPRSDFRGRMYASGYSESCSAAGQGRARPTTLLVPFLSRDCGVSQAYALEEGGKSTENKTLMYTLLVIQNNPIIQAQGDRFVRVGCVAPPSFNLTLGTDINVGNDSEDKTHNGNFDGSSSIPASSIINTTGAGDVPKVRMYIINDPEKGDPTAQVSGGAVSLGETIELRIESETSKSDVDIHAYHLVASSQLGDSSVLLLDGRGCPTGQVDFPALVRTELHAEKRGGKSGAVGTITPIRVGRDTSRGGPVATKDAGRAVRLSARFRAFRFPNSHVVKFSVMVQFCAGSCEEVNCDTQSASNRYSRSVHSEATIDFEEQTPHPAVETFVPYENASITFLDKPLMRGLPARNAHIVVASSDSNARMRDMCKEINESHDSKVPLELSLIVASNDLFSADRLIYGENNNILVAAVEDRQKTIRNSMICIHEALFISITFIWLLVQTLLLVGCMVVIKRYRSFVEENQIQKDYHSFDNLGFDGISATRRVHWPDQHFENLHT